MISKANFVGPLSKILQNQQRHLAEALNLIKDLRHIIKQNRNNFKNDFKNIFKDVGNVLNKIGKSVETNRPNPKCSSSEQRLMYR